jgi:hypothetical protein
MFSRFGTHEAASISRMEHSARIDVRRKTTTTIKTMKTTIKTLIAAAFAVGLATSVSAAPPGKGTGVLTGASTQEEIQKLKTGDRYAKVCMDCKSITMKEVADEKEVAALCHEGGTMHCDGCKKQATIKHSGPPGKGSTSSKVTMVNADGKECMFIVPMKE